MTYDSTTTASQFVEVFVAPGGGGLGLPHSVTFGPDGDLYVSSESTHRVLRYDGETGAFIEDFVPAASGGLDSPRSLSEDSFLETKTATQ